LKTQSSQLAFENEVYSRYIARRFPKDMSDGEEEGEEEGRGGRRGKKGKKRSEKNMPTTLTIDQKYDIMAQELEDLKDDREKARGEGERLLDNLKSYLEDADVKLAEMKKESYEFKRDVLSGTESLRTGRTMSEKIQRWFEERTRLKESLGEKLKMKNKSLKTQISQLDGQLQHKEEIGEVLHVIDFDQLKIENQQNLEKIEERNKELLRLKQTTGNTVQKLNDLKKRLSALTSESEWLGKATKEKREAIDKISEEIVKVEKEFRSAEGQNQKLKKKIESTRMPQILDNVAQKAELYELKKKVQNWERKCEIMELEAKQARVNARKMGASATNMTGAF